MRKLNLAIAMLVGAAVFSGCALNKMIKLANDQELTVEPNPLEVHGGTVPLELSVVLPPKMLPSGKVYTLNTIYQYGDQEVQVGSMEFSGDEFPNSSSSTSRKSATFEFDYVEGMNPGTLYVQGVASDPNSGKSKSTERMAVAQGLASTSLFAKPITFATYADHGYNDQEELVPTNVEFHFPQGISSLRPSFSVAGTSNRVKINNLEAFIADKNVTRTVTITGTHSPEGPERVNRNLAQDRAEEIEQFYRRQMRKYDYKGAADSIKFILKPVVLEWEPLKQYLANNNVLTEQQGDQVRRIINGTGSFVEKEDELHKLPFYDKLLKEVYPNLRTAKTEVLTVKEKLPNSKIAVLSKQIVEGQVNADTLSQEEFLFSATLTPSLDEKAAIFQAATKGGSWKAHNNLAAVYLKQAEKAEGSEKTELIQNAITQLEIAKNKTNSPAIAANLAAANIMQNNFEQALSSLSDAEGASPSNETASNISGMKGSIQLMNGSYDEALASFANSAEGSTVTFDRGLTQLLKGNYEEAQSTLSNVTSDEKLGAQAYYLMAVAAARQNAPEDITEYLGEAVGMEPSFKSRALNDLEFTNYSDAVADAVE